MIIDLEKWENNFVARNSSFGRFQLKYSYVHKKSTSWSIPSYPNESIDLNEHV